jgi:hypothetical protein
MIPKRLKLLIASFWDFFGQLRAFVSRLIGLRLVKSGKDAHAP